MEQKEHTGKIKWHPGFWGGIELELRKYRDILDFEPEYCLSKEPLRMDMLIIKKKKNVVIDNPIAEIFREHNVIEYKSPNDALTIDAFYKTIGYACLYKGLGETVGQISEKELTVSIFRHTKPREMFSALKAAGATIENIYPGIYHVRGIIHIPVQIIVTKELEKGEHSVLKILTGNADEYEVRRFIDAAGKYDTPIDRQNADAVLQVSVSSNKGLYKRLSKEERMCEALNELMKDQLDAREACGEARGKAQGIEMLGAAIREIRSGVGAGEIKKKYGESVWKEAKALA